MSVVVNSFRNLKFRQKSCYFNKKDELYVQVYTKDDNFNELVKDKFITFKLSRSIRIYGQVSRITKSGFYMKNWSINKGEKFANEQENN